MRYDVIIIGVGAADAVLAARLSEDRQRSVLLLDAGPDYLDIQPLPADLRHGNNSGPAAAGPHTWSYTAIATTHQTQPMSLPRGKVVGGSSTINGTILLRGLPEDFDHWAAWGTAEGSYVKILPYFRKIERDLNYHGDFHGSQGPMPVRRHTLETITPTQVAFYRACLDAGFPHDPDLNLPESWGVGFWPKNNLNGLRMSTMLTSLNPARHRGDAGCGTRQYACDNAHDGGTCRRLATGLRARHSCPILRGGENNVHV